MIPRKVKKIGGNGYFNGAFEYCRNLRSVVFEKGSELTEIGDSAFRECKNMQKIFLPDNLREIGKEAFSWAGLTEAQIPASV